jgi:hypothetical protein
MNTVLVINGELYWKKGDALSDTFPAETPAPQKTKASLSADPLGQAERAQVMFEKGPITSVAAFFTCAFFVALYLLLRAKDKQQAAQAKLQAEQAKEISRLMEKHSEEMTALYTDERDRAVKHEVTMSNYLDMMDDVRFIAFEMRRVKMAREKKQRTSGEFETAKGDPDDKD